MNVCDDIYEEDDFGDIYRLLHDSDDENVQRGGSRVGRSTNIERDRALGAAHLHADYLADSPTYPEHMFERRFRVSHQIFERICETLEANYPFF